MCKDMDDEHDNTEPIRNPMFGMTDYFGSLLYINTAPSRIYSNIVNPSRPTQEDIEDQDREGLTGIKRKVREPHIDKRWI